MGEEKKQVISLIRKALNGKLSLESLYISWPESLESDPFFERVYDHIESAVEHYPADLIGKPDASKFIKSREYKILKRDLEILETK